jgi:hypothetical protein
MPLAWWLMIWTSKIDPLSSTNTLLRTAHKDSSKFTKRNIEKLWLNLRILTSLDLPKKDSLLTKTYKNTWLKRNKATVLRPQKRDWNRIDMNSWTKKTKKPLKTADKLAILKATALCTTSSVWNMEPQLSGINSYKWLLKSILGTFRKGTLRISCLSRSNIDSQSTISQINSCTTFQRLYRRLLRQII